MVINTNKSDSTAGYSDHHAAPHDVVFLGDSRNLNRIPDGSVSLVVTSPPYFNLKDYSKDGHQKVAHSRRHHSQLGDIEEFEEFVLELRRVWRECSRVLVPNGKLAINAPLLPMTKAQLRTHENRHIFDLNSAIQNSILQGVPDLYLLDTYVWNRTNPSKRLMFGSYPSPTNFYAQNTIEFVTVYVKAGKPRKVSKEIRESSRLSQQEWLEFTKQVWNIPVPNKGDSAFGQHSALMPEEIVRRCVRLYSFVDDLVLDPFAGSGTTLKVAKDLGRRAVGYEVVEAYKATIEQKVDGVRCEMSVKKGQIPILQPTEKVIHSQFLNRVVKSDASSFLAKLPSNCINLICVDPPYNLGKGEWDTFKSPSEYRRFTAAWINESVRVLAPGGSMFLFNTPENSAFVLEYCRDLDLQFRNWITWDKRDGFGASRSRFVSAQETILYLTKPGGDPVFNCDAVRVPYESTDRISAARKTGILKDGKRWFPNPQGKLCTDVWHISSERHRTKVRGRVQKPQHPTQKPLELIQRIVRAASNPGDLVLDFFAGSGTTAVAALALGRQFVGCEANLDYVSLANSRLADLPSGSELPSESDLDPRTDDNAR